MISMMVRTILAVLALGMAPNSGRSSVSRSRSAPAFLSLAYRSFSRWIACAQGPPARQLVHMHACCPQHGSSSEH